MKISEMSLKTNIEDYESIEHLDIKFCGNVSKSVLQTDMNNGQNWTGYTNKICLRKTVFWHDVGLCFAY